MIKLIPLIMIFMKGDTALLLVLSIIFFCLFLLQLMGLGMVIYKNFILEDSIQVIKDNGKSSAYRNWFRDSEYGYPIPVLLGVSYPDTIFSIEGYNDEVSNSFSQSWNKMYGDMHNKVDERWEIIEENFDSIVRRDTAIFEIIATHEGLNKDFGSNKFGIRDWSFDYPLRSYRRNSAFEVVPEIRIKEATIHIKPKDTYQKIILVARTYLGMFFYLFIFYYLFRTVSRPNSKQTFNRNLSSRVAKVGLVFILYSVAMYALDYTIKQWYWSIHSLSASTYGKVDQIVSLNFGYGGVNFEFEYFLVGLLVILVAVLIRRAAAIEEQWSLMI